MSVTIQLVPLGPVPREVFAFLQDQMATVFSACVGTGSNLPVPTRTYHRQRRQFNSSAILEWLQQLDVAVGTIVLAGTREDLYADSLRFVFGEADPQGKRAIISLARLYASYPGQPFSEELLRERALKEAIHEIGHVFGLLHCPEPRCVMRFSNSLDDADVKMADFCRFCAQTRYVFEKWHYSTPANFAFAVKSSRFITHVKKLAHPEEHVALFLEHASGLGEKLHVMLFQLPPSWIFDRGRLEGLCDFLSRQKIVPGIRSALEVRHASWYCDACLDVLTQYRVSLVVADWPTCSVEGPPTADFVFVRRHGPESLYASSYSDSSLQHEAQRIRAWVAEGRSVYVYFNNDADGYAVRNALRLREILSQAPPVASA